MTFQIKTPLLAKAARAAETVLTAETLDPEIVKLKLAAAGTATRAVGQELRVRLATPKLAEIDKKYADQVK